MLPPALSPAGEDTADDGLRHDAGWPGSCTDCGRREAMLWRFSEGACRLGERPRMLSQPLELSLRPLLLLRRSVSLPPRRRELADRVVRPSRRLRLGELTWRDR